jgi:hypothetical protein
MGQGGTAAQVRTYRFFVAFVLLCTVGRDGKLYVSTLPPWYARRGPGTALNYPARIGYLPNETAAGGGESRGDEAPACGVVSGFEASDSEGSQLAREARERQEGGIRTPRHPGSTAAPNERKVLPMRGTSRFRGVSWQKKVEKWHANISHLRKTRYISRFDNEEEAARAYDREALRLK